MGNLIEINKKRAVFTLGEARRQHKIAFKVTEEYSTKVQPLFAQLERIPQNHADHREAIDDRIRDLVSAWSDKIRKLGGLPNGLWVVDYDSGDGYFCWKYPEAELGHWHPYDAGFSGRIRIAEA